MKISDPVIQEALKAGKPIKLSNYPEKFAVVLTDQGYFMYADYPNDDERHLLQNRMVEAVDSWEIIE